MATVRISNELSKTITDNAGRIFDKQINAAEQALPPNWTAQSIFDRWLDADPRRRSTVEICRALGWMTGLYSYWTIQIHDGLPSGTRNVLYNYRPNTVPAGQFPRDLRESIVIPSLEVDEREFAAELAFFRQRTETLKELQFKRTEYVGMVKKVLRNASTLKQALGIWPALWELVPQDVRDKHNEVSARREKATKETLDLDVDSLNSGLVVAKMTGAL